MKTAIANKKLEELIAKVNKKGVEDKSIIDDLKGLREQALLEKDPLVVKVLRLTYEYLEEHNAFDVKAQFDENEEGDEFAIEIDDKENLVYLLELLENAEQKINRSEIKDYRTALKEDLY